MYPQGLLKPGGTRLLAKIYNGGQRRKLHPSAKNPSPPGIIEKRRGGELGQKISVRSIRSPMQDERFKPSTEPYARHPFCNHDTRTDVSLQRDEVLEIVNENNRRNETASSCIAARISGIHSLPISYPREADSSGKKES